MGRPTKQGLEYFSLDVRFFSDIKIRKLIKYHKAQAVSVYMTLLCRIYEKGYFIDYDEDLPFIISEDCGLEENTIVSIIHYCIEIGLFDAGMYQQYKVLTSHGIQDRYVQACAKTKRKLSSELPYLLVDLSQESVSSEKKGISSEKTPVSSEETVLNFEESAETSEKSAQSKVKKRKENDIDSSLRSESPSSAVATTDKGEDINFLAFMDFFNRTMQEHNAVIATITDMTKKRREAVRARARKYGKEALQKVVLNAACSAFMNGDNKDSWVADFNWIFKPNNFVKVLEGNFNHIVSKANFSYHGTDSNNGYRSREEIDAGTLRTLARMSAAAEQPKKDLPVV